MDYICEENFEELIKTAHERFDELIGDGPLGDEPIQLGLYANARIKSFQNQRSHVELIYNEFSREPYEISVIDIQSNRGYRWLHPQTKEERIKIGPNDSDFSRNPNYTSANWVETESIDDILDKVNGIYNDKPYDPRVVVVFDLSEEDLRILKELADTRGIDLDALIESILYEELKRIDGE